METFAHGQNLVEEGEVDVVLEVLERDALPSSTKLFDTPTLDFRGSELDIRDAL